MKPTASSNKNLKTVSVASVEEVEQVEVRGNFRGYWRATPEKTLTDGTVIPAGKRFKIERVVLVEGVKVKQTAWLNEADAAAWNLVEGVRYAFALSCADEMTADKNNGNPAYLDEYALGDVAIVEVNGRAVPPVTE